jgi:hypothetical protein
METKEEPIAMPGEDLGRKLASPHDSGILLMLCNLLDPVRTSNNLYMQVGSVSMIMTVNGPDDLGLEEAIRFEHDSSLQHDDVPMGAVVLKHITSACDRLIPSSSHDLLTQVNMIQKMIPYGS